MCTRVYLNMKMAVGTAIIKLYAPWVHSLKEKRMIIRSITNKTKNHFNISINEIRDDEFHELNSNFNTMVSTINTLINELYKQKIIEKDMQLKALLANINPHFLYNIFESMIWMLELQKYDELNDMIIALSNYYRLTLSGGREIVTVSESMEQIKNYITCLLYTSPSPRDRTRSRMPSSA